MLKTGIRTELLLNLTLLAGAALLFSCILLVKVAERKFLSQQIETARNIVQVMVQGGLVEELAHDNSEEKTFQRIDSMLQTFPDSASVQGWAFYDSRLKRISSHDGNSGRQYPVSILKTIRFSRENLVRVEYSGITFSSAFGSEKNPGEIKVFAPCRSKLGFAGIFMVRFSLAGMSVALNEALILILVYGSGVALIGIGFGYVLLGRTILGPLNRLEKSTRRVSEGDLEQVVPTEGPRELFNLGRSFNAMTASLRARKQQTRDHIRQLQTINDELQEAREELIRSEKMASVGQLAAGMAHEIGNPLGAVQGYLEFLRRGDREPMEKDIIERSLSEIERINRLVRDLLDYASPEQEDEQVFDPAETVREAIAILKSQRVLEAVEIHDKLPCLMSSVRMPRHKLIQVLVNLLLNARDAMAGAGIITLTGGEEAESLWITVSDSGEGVKKQDLRCIFDPFYTTKKPGKGRGLGLSVCQRIMKEAGGRIEPRSGQETGAAFKVTFRKVECEACFSPSNEMTRFLSKVSF